MADENVTQLEVAKLRLSTNSGGDRVFENDAQLVYFLRDASNSVTALLMTLIEADNGDHHTQDTLNAINDLAWQVQQSVELLFPNEEMVHG